MNEDSYAVRLGKVEAEIAHQGERMDRMERDLTKINSGVQTLIQQAAARGEGFTLKTAGQYAFAIGSLGAFVWAIIAMSPSIHGLEKRWNDDMASLDKRLGRLDDREIGKVTRLELSVRQLEGWRAGTTVTMARP